MNLKKHLYLVIGLIILIVIIRSLKTEESFLPQEYRDKEITIEYDMNGAREVAKEEIEHEAIIFDGINDYLNNARQITSYDNLEIYWEKDDINFDFYLNGEVEKNQIVKIRDFFINFAIGGNRESIGYGGAIHYYMSKNSDRIEDRHLRIFIDNTLVLKYRFKMYRARIEEKAYFENYLIDIVQRKELDIETVEFETEIKEIIKLKSESVTKAIKPYTAIIKLRIEGEFDQSLMPIVKNTIENKLINANKEKLEQLECSEFLVFIYSDQKVS